MNKSLYASLPAIAVVVALITFGVSLRSQALGRQPHTRTVRIMGYDANGVRQNYFDTAIVVALRADGSQSQTTSFPNAYPDRAPIQEIADLGNNTITAIDHYARLYTVVSSKLETYRRPVSASCEQHFGVPCTPAGKILGIDAYLVELPRIPAGSPKRVRMWVAPQATWAPLRQETFNEIAGAIVNEQVVTDIVFGEPNPSLFQIPSTYRKASDTVEFYKDSAASRGHQVPQKSLEAMKERENLKRQRSASGFKFQEMLAKINSKLAFP